MRREAGRADAAKFAVQPLGVVGASEVFDNHPSLGEDPELLSFSSSWSRWASLRPILAELTLPAREGRVRDVEFLSAHYADAAVSDASWVMFPVCTFDATARASNAVLTRRLRHTGR